MKKILISGKDSYIGTNFKNYLKNYPNKYLIDELDMTNDSWKNYDFNEYDTVFHVAGLAHSTPDESQRDIYYKVNTDLTFEVAKKAKESGVQQFVFMSSIIVYGSGNLGENRIITKESPLNPDNFYGDSKKQAEIKIQSLQDEYFKIVIIRSPMIYGPKAKGNYSKLAKIARVSPIFPNYINQRSMLFLGNLINFVKLMIDNEECGIFVPQNDEYVCTLQLVEKIAELHNHKIFKIGIANCLLKLFKRKAYINKLFGNMTIEKALSEYKEVYNIYSFAESVAITEDIFE